MYPLLRYKTKIGFFYICRSHDGKFHPVFDNESLGSYIDVRHAVSDIANDATFSVLHPETLELVDTSALGLPDDYREWIRCNPQ